MGITSGQFGSDDKEIVVEGCYTPTDTDLPVRRLYAHILRTDGEADQILGYSLDGLRPDPFVISLATLEPGGGTWAPGVCLCFVPDPIERVVLGAFGTLAPPAILQPPAPINNSGGTFEAVFPYDLGRGVTINIRVTGVQISGPPGVASVIMVPAGNLIFNLGARSWRFRFDSEYKLDWQMSIGQVNGAIGESINFDGEPVTSYIQNAGDPLVLPYNGPWQNNENATPSYFGWSDVDSVSYTINVINSIIITPSILNQPDILEIDCDCVCPPTKIADLYETCGDAPGALVHTGNNLLANNEMRAGFGFGSSSVFGAGWTTDYPLPAANNILAAPSIALFNINLSQIVPIGPPAAAVLALSDGSVAVNFSNIGAQAAFRWQQIFLENGKSYEFSADMARVFNPLVAFLNFYNYALVPALVFATPMVGATVPLIWQRPVTTFTWSAPTGYYRVEIAPPNGGPPSNVHAFDTFSMREAELRSVGFDTEVGYSSTVRAVIQQVVSVEGCNDARRDELAADILQRLSPPCSDPILTETVDKAAEVMCDFGLQGYSFPAPVLNLFPGFATDYLQFDSAGPDQLTGVEFVPYGVGGPALNFPLLPSPLTSMTWNKAGTLLQFLTGNIPNRLNRIRTYNPVTLALVSDILLTGTALLAPIQTVIDGVDFGFNSIAYDVDGQLWGLAQGIDAPIAPGVVNSQWWKINPATGESIYHSEAPSPLIGGGPGFTNGSFTITTTNRWFYSSGPAPQDITGLTHAIEVAPHGSVAIAPLPYVTFPPSPNYYGLRMAPGPNGSLLTTIQDGFLAEELYYIDPEAPVTPQLLSGPHPEGFNNRVWGYSPFPTVPRNYPGFGEGEPFRFVRTWEQDCDGTFNPIDKTIEGETYLPVGPVGSCADSDASEVFTVAECLEYILAGDTVGYFTGEELRDNTGLVYYTSPLIPTLDSVLNSAGQNYDTGLLYVPQVIPNEIVVIDPYQPTPSIVNTLVITGAAPYPGYWRATSFDPASGEMWMFGSLGVGFTIEAYNLNTDTGVLSLRFTTSQLMNFGGAGASFTSDGRLYMSGDDLGDFIVERDPFIGNILQQIATPAGFWATRGGMHFDANDVLHIANYSTNVIETYQIVLGSPSTLVPVGVYGGFVDQNNFALLRDLPEGPVSFRRYFHKNLDTDAVTTQDHDILSGQVIGIPETAEVGRCGEFQAAQDRNPRFRTEVVDVPPASSYIFSANPGLISWTVRNRNPTDGTAALTVNGNTFIMDGGEVISSGGVNEENGLLADGVGIVTIGPTSGARIILMRRI